jgi:hypothetical protein
MFLTEDDYKVVCDEVELDVLTQSSPDIRRQAERVAMEEVSSYIRPKYDTDKAFAAQGEERNYMLLQVVANITLWYLAQWLPGSLSLDRRQLLYEQAVEWLTKVSKGTTMPDLPGYTSEDGTETASGPVRFGGMPRSTYDY